MEDRVVLGVVFCVQNYFNGVIQHSFNGVMLTSAAACGVVGVSSLVILTFLFLFAHFMYLTFLEIILQILL